MSKGLSGLFSGTRGQRAAAGSANYMASSDDFRNFISKRKDIDVNGFYDVVAHGDSDSIRVFHNGKELEITHRVLANLLKRDPNYKSGAIRLLSCNTGSDAGQFAQNLANKLGVPVKAPTDLLWTLDNGVYFVAKGLNGSIKKPDMTKRGRFKTFYPRKENK